MNFGLVLLALFIVCGATASIFFIGQQTQVGYNDTWSQPPTQYTNQTHDLIANTTARVAPAGGGMAFIFGGMLIFTGIVYIGHVFTKQGGYSQRR